MSNPCWGPRHTQCLENTVQLKCSKSGEPKGA